MQHIAIDIELRKLNQCNYYTSQDEIFQEKEIGPFSTVNDGKCAYNEVLRSYIKDPSFLRHGTRPYFHYLLVSPRIAHSLLSGGNSVLNVHVHLLNTSDIYLVNEFRSIQSPAVTRGCCIYKQTPSGSYQCFYNSSCCTGIIFFISDEVIFFYNV